MSEEMLVTIMPRDDGSGVDVEMAGEISPKFLVIGASMMAARVCILADISPETFLVLLYAALQNENGQDEDPET